MEEILETILKEEEALQEMFGDEAEYLDDDMGNK